MHLLLTQSDEPGPKGAQNSQMSAMSKTPRPAKAYRFISSAAFFRSIFPRPPATCHIPKTTQQHTNSRIPKEGNSLFYIVQWNPNIIVKGSGGGKRAWFQVAVDFLGEIFPTRRGDRYRDRAREPVIVAGIEKLPTERTGMELPWLPMVVGMSVGRRSASSSATSNSSSNPFTFRFLCLWPASNLRTTESRNLRLLGLKAMNVNRSVLGHEPCQWIMLPWLELYWNIYNYYYYYRRLDWIGAWQRSRHLFSPDCSPSSHRMFSLGIKGLASAFYLHHHLFVFFCTVCSTSPGAFSFLLDIYMARKLYWKLKVLKSSVF